jgi:hypothetical protein
MHPPFNTEPPASLEAPLQPTSWFSGEPADLTLGLHEVTQFGVQTEFVLNTWI